MASNLVPLVFVFVFLFLVAWEVQSMLDPNVFGRFQSPTITDSRFPHFAEFFVFTLQVKECIPSDKEAPKQC